MKYDLHPEITLDIYDNQLKREDRQDSAFYDEGKIASLSYKNRTINVYCLGEMKICYQDNYLHTPEKVIEAGFINDKELATLEEKGGEWINNSWFEIFADNDYNLESGEVLHTTKDAIETAGVWLLDDSLWKVSA